jgi:hypothetical protein
MKHYDTFTGVTTEEEIDDLPPIAPLVLLQPATDNTDETPSAD